MNQIKKDLQVIRKHYDVVVVGSGGAGSAAAETAASKGLKVLLVSKDPIVCSDSKISEGIITVRGSYTDSDTEKELSDNLRVQGDDLGNSQLADAFAKDSRSAYGWLQDYGIQANIDSDTNTPKPLPIPMGGHSMARSIDHKNSGLEYGHACWNALHNSEMDTLEDAWFIDLYTQVEENERNGTEERSICGGLIYHASTGNFISVKAASVVLACGGLSTLYYPNTDTMRGNTGDAYAIAARAGAKLVDMEQIQFIPFAVANSRSYQGLVVGEPIIAGILGTLKDRDGKVIKSEIMGRTRAECAAAIARAVADGRGTENDACYLDLTENSQGKSGQAYVSLMQEKIPSLLKIVKGAMGTKAAKFQERWEVRPSAHYVMGGIKANAHCQVLDQNDKVIRGLFAAGQAMGGLHGSNRLGSTSLAEGIIFGRRAGESASIQAGKSLQTNNQTESPFDESFITLEEDMLKLYREKFVSEPEPSKTFAIHLQRSLQKSAWQGIGPARTHSSVSETLDASAKIGPALESLRFDDDLVWNQHFIDYLESKNMLLCAHAVAKSALNRETSLGAHVRLDEDHGLAKRLMPASPYSTETVLVKDGLKTRLEVHRATREKSKLSAILKVKLKEKGKIAAFKAIKSLPLKQRDKILFKIYSNAISEKIDFDELQATAEASA